MRCSFLDGNGKQCRNEALKKPHEFHGNSETFYVGNENEAHWVRVFWCKKHKEANVN